MKFQVGDIVQISGPHYDGLLVRVVALDAGDYVCEEADVPGSNRRRFHEADLLPADERAILMRNVTQAHDEVDRAEKRYVTALDALKEYDKKNRKQEA